MAKEPFENAHQDVLRNLMTQGQTRTCLSGKVTYEETHKGNFLTLKFESRATDSESHPLVSSETDEGTALAPHFTFTFKGK